jgi:hypothetical protein
MNVFRKTAIAASIYLIGTASFAGSVNASVNANGPSSALTITATVTPTADFVSNNSKLYLAIVQGADVYFYSDTAGFVSYAGGLGALTGSNPTEAPFVRAITKNSEIINLAGDARGVVGGNVYVGYGATFAELIGNARYSNLFTIGNPCDVVHHVYGEVKSPAEYGGAFDIPTPTQRLPAQIIKAVAFKDYYPGYLPQGGACTDRIAHARSLYVETLDRMQADGVQQTYIYNYGQWDDFKKPVWSVSPSDYQIPASEVTFVVAEAAKRGIKVVLNWQFTDTDKVGSNLGMGRPVTAERLRQMLISFRPLIVNQAAVGEQIGLAGIYVDWNAFWIPNLTSDPVLREIWITEMVAIIADVKRVFHGKIYYGSNTSVIDPRIAVVIDQFTLSLTVPYQSISPAQNDALTVDMVKQAFLVKIREERANYDAQMVGSSVHPPITWVVAVQSKKDYFLNGWTEDGFCVIGGTNPCVQLTYVTDNSVQAIGTEAALQAITAQTQFTTGTVNFDTSYWMTDDVTPVDYGWSSFANVHQYDFPNLSQSIRNKPAEGIVRYWYGK